jgi:hypothetical protein
MTWLARVPVPFMQLQPAVPAGWSRPWSGPATKPLREIDMWQVIRVTGRNVAGSQNVLRGGAADRKRCSAATCGHCRHHVQRLFSTGRYFSGMDEFRARRVVDSLRDRGVNAHLLRGGIGKFGVRVPLPGGRQAEWDTDGTAGLEAQVMRDGMLVGYVPRIAGSEDFDESRIIDAIARTDYDQPVARQRTETPAPAPALPREGGVFRRFLDGFRYQ